MVNYLMLFSLQNLKSSNSMPIPSVKTHTQRTVVWFLMLYVTKLDVLNLLSIA